MKETEYISCFHQSILFFCFKKRYLIMKIHNNRELQNIAINHSADIDYKNFMKIYRKHTTKLYSFLTIDATLPTDDPLHFRGNRLDSL